MEKTRGLSNKYFLRKINLMFYKLLILYVLFFIIVSSHVHSKQDNPVDAGSETFKHKCASCHGENAKGKDVENTNIGTDVPDLTMISKRNDGQFPLSRIYAVIDGREVLEQHGTRAMPTWGNLFLSDTIWDGCSQVDEQIVRGRILELILYLEDIQQ